MFMVAGLEIISQVTLTLLKLQEKPVLYSIANIFKLTVSLLLIILFIIKLGRKLEGIYEAQIIGQIVFFLILSKFIWQNFKFKFDFGLMKEMLVFSIPLVLSNVSGIILSIADRYFLKFIGALSDVGIYSLGYKIGNVIKVFVIQSVMLALSPIIYKMMDDPKNKRFYSKSLTYMGYGIMIFVLILSLFGKEMVMLLAQKDEFWPAYKIIPLIAFTNLFIALRQISTTGLNLMKKTKVRAVIVVSISVLNIILNLILIPYFQAIGAGIALIISQIIYFVLIFRYSQIHYPVPYEISKILKIIFIGLLMVIIGFLINDINLFLRLSLKFVLILSFPILLYFLNFYEQIEIIRLKQFIFKISNKIFGWEKNYKSE